MLPQEILHTLQVLTACQMENAIFTSGATVEVDEVGGAEGAPETSPRRLGRGGAMEEGAAEIGELGAEGGECGVEISPVLDDIAMAPAMVMVMAAQLAVLELGGGCRLRRLRRHLGGSRVCTRERLASGVGQANGRFAEQGSHEPLGSLTHAAPAGIQRKAT